MHHILADAKLGIKCDRRFVTIIGLYIDHPRAARFGNVLQFGDQCDGNTLAAMRFGDGRREFLSMPWDGTSSDGVARRYMVWGATAAMLRNLYRFLSA